MLPQIPNCEPSIFNDIQKSARLFGGMPIALLGMITNIVNIVVFLDQEMRCSLVNHFLLVCNFIVSFAKESTTGAFYFGPAALGLQLFHVNFSCNRLYERLCCSPRRLSDYALVIQSFWSSHIFSSLQVLIPDRIEHSNLWGLFDRLGLCS